MEAFRKALAAVWSAVMSVVRADMAVPCDWTVACWVFIVFSGPESAVMIAETIESVSIPEDSPVKLMPLLDVPVPNVIDILRLP